ncbi:hypothetical protein C3B79_2706 [Aeromonas hydrophila]|nr:hypothetical protein C3B79_2706 [Aeromonas hydrophila]
MLTKVADHGVDGVGLIGSENEHAGLGDRCGVMQDGAIIGILAPKNSGPAWCRPAGDNVFA